MVYRLSVLFALLTLLAACGGAPVAVQPTSAPAAATNAPATAVPTPARQPTTAPAADAYPRTITDGAGNQVTLPARPERIAVLDPLTSLEALLALGVAPAQIGQRSFVADYLGDPLLQWPWLEAALAATGAQPERINADETNLEAVAGAQPDLIIGQSYWVDQQRDLLSRVAPTLTTPLADVRAAITLLGEALALEDEAARVIAEWDARLAAEVEGSVPPGKSVAIIRTDGEGTFTVFNTAGYGPYDMLMRAGFTVPPALAAAPKSANGLGSEFSLERLDVLDAADVIVVLGFSVAETDQLLVNPLFTRVPAVAAGRVVRVEQGPVAQALAIQSPLNLDTVLPVVREAAALAGSAAGPAATRTVTDDLGRTVEVPASPRRVVALQDLQVLRPLLDLGVTPIAAVTHPRAEGAYRYVEEYDVSGVEVIGLLGEPNLERLVQLKPDLIIGTLSAGTDEQLETLSAIAPTVVYNAGRPVTEYHRSLAAAVGALEAYDALMADYEARLAELRAGVAPISAELVVSLLAFNPNAGQIEIGEGPYTLIFRGAGIRQPEAQVNFESADEGVRRYWISLEQLPEHDADLIMLLSSGDPAVNAPITGSPIWGQLAAVRAGQVVEIDGGTWYVQSVRSLFNVIDTLEQHLVQAEVDTGVVP